ncbi:acetate--CoA ligase family protein [Alphaproteobacteria bacterium LSUCC0684]
MVRSGLNRLLRPRHIAVLGGRWAEAVIVSLKEMGFEGGIWPVHPEKKEISGLPVFPDIDALPEPPDACFLGVNRSLTIEMVEKLRSMGAGGAVAFASGFAEVGDGAALQKRLVEAAGDMPVLGPNCYGMINYLDGALLWPDVHGGTRVERGVAIITQSSNLSINLTMQEGGLPIAYMLTLGNQAMIGMAELVRAVAEDDRVSAIGLHIEGFNDAAGFADAVHLARKAGKPVIAMKAGASEGARQMTFSHTASLAGSHAVAGAFLARLGVGMVNGIEAFLAALGLAHTFGRLDEVSILTLSCSGGEASLIADTAQRHGIPMPVLDAAASARIAATVNPLVTVSNPFDYHTFDWGNRERLEKTFAAAMQAGQAISVLILDFPSTHLGRAEDWQIALDAWLAARDHTGSRAAVLSSLPDCLPRRVAGWLIEHGIAPLRGFDASMEALAALRQASRPSSFRPTGITRLDRPEAPLSETAAKEELKAAGVPVPEGGIMASLDAALAFADGQKVVMKRSGLAHKTEAGGVRLGLSDPGDIRRAWAEFAPHGPVLVEEMVEDALAEVLVGVARDPVLGLHLVIGAGGIAAEMLQDTALLMLPASRGEVRAALEGLRMAPLLHGFRGSARADIDALLDLIDAVQRFALSHEADLMELDLNPVLVRGEGKGVLAVDALIRYAS